MAISRSFAYGLGMCAVLVLLAGCGGGSPPGYTPGAVPAAHPDRGRSWMSPNAKHQNLLYVSDSSTYDVYVFSYPKGKLVGTLTDQNNPGGMCVDTKGDVFITQLYGGGHIVEYAHGGTTQLESLPDPGYEPGGCSVDPASGDLAVSNIITDSFAVGDLLVFKGAKGSPAVYKPPYQSAAGGEWGSVNTVGYDDKGNIFVAGHAYPDSNAFGELPNGASALENITLKQNFGSGIGNVQWDGKHITFASVAGSVWGFVVKKLVGKVVSSTIVYGSQQVDVGWIQGNTLIAPQQFAKEVFFYDYPAGGNPTKKIAGLSAPFGVTVSLAKK